MGVISFRAPQEGLDQIQKALDMMTLVHEIAHNPAMGDTIVELSKKISEAQILSETNKKELLDAQEVIAQSKDFIEEFEKEKAAHKNEVRINKAEIENARQSLNADLETFSKEKASMQNQLVKNKQEVDQVLVKSDKLNEEAKSRIFRAEQLEKQTAEKIDAHQKMVEDFQVTKKQIEDEFLSREAKLSSDIAKLNKDREVFEARKKRFDEALKE